MLTSRISTLCSGRYMHVIKCLRHHLSGRWSCFTGGHYIERSLTYREDGSLTLREDHNMAVKDRWLL